jgi:hypothetical protein
MISEAEEAGKSKMGITYHAGIEADCLSKIKIIFQHQTCRPDIISIYFP